MRDYFENLTRTIVASGHHRAAARAARASREMQPRHGRSTYQPVRDAALSRSTR